MPRTRRESLTSNPLLILIGVILILYFARAILIPLAFALAFSFLLAPMVAWLQKLRLPRLPSVALAVIISAAAIAGLGWVVARQVLEIANDLPNYRSNIHTKIEALHYPPNSAFGRATESLKEIGNEFSEPETTPSSAGSRATPVSPSDSRLKPVQPRAPVPVQIVDTPPAGFAGVRELLLPLVKPLGATGMVVIFTVFILIKKEDLRNRLLRLAGVDQLHAMTLALDDAALRISRYLSLLSVVNASYGVCFGAGLFLIGIPNAPLWGVMAGLLRIVPYAGALTAAACPLLVSLVVFNGWGPPVLVILLYVLLEVIAANLVEPWLYGTYTGISSLALLVTTVFWTILWGWAGLVLAIPLTVCVIVVGRYVPRLSFLHILLGDETALSFEAQFYQRLLALEQDDARAIVTNYLRDHTLLSLYDQVLIPALTLAEQDRHKGAMDERRESFVFLGVSEIVSELAVYRKDESPRPARRLGLHWFSPARPQFTPDEVEAGASAMRVFCFAANDHADEIICNMLAQLLERAGHGVVSLPAGGAIEQILEHLAPESNDVICISALPPFAYAQASAVCQRVRIQFPQSRVLVGIWGCSDDLEKNDCEKAMQRFGSTPPDALVPSLEKALQQIAAWRKPEETAAFGVSVDEPNDAGLRER